MLLKEYCRTTFVTLNNEYLLNKMVKCYIFTSFKPIYSLFIIYL